METHKLIHTGKQGGGPGARPLAPVPGAPLPPPRVQGGDTVHLLFRAGLFQSVWSVLPSWVAPCQLKVSPPGLSNVHSQIFQHWSSIPRHAPGGRPPSAHLGPGHLSPRLSRGSRADPAGDPGLYLPPRVRGQWASSGRAPCATRSTSPSICCRSTCSSRTTKWRRRAASCAGPRCPPGPP